MLTIGLNRAVVLLAEAETSAPRRGPQLLRELGPHPEGGTVALYRGRYGPYVSHDGVFASLPKSADPETFTLEAGGRAACRRRAARPRRERPSAGSARAKAGQAGAAAERAAAAAKMPARPARRPPSRSRRLNALALAPRRPPEQTGGRRAGQETALGRAAGLDGALAPVARDAETRADAEAKARSGRAAVSGRHRGVHPREPVRGRQARDRPRLRGPARRSAGAARHAAPDRALGNGDPRRQSATRRRTAAARGHRVERFGTDEDGVPLARPVAWPGPEPAPILRLADAAGEAIPIGARAAARLVALDTGEIEARIIRRLDRGGDRVVGVFRQGPRRRPGDAGRPPQQNRIPGRRAARPPAPTMTSWSSPRRCRPRRFGSPRARIVERLGAVDASRRDQPPGDRLIRHSDRVSGRRARRGRGGAAGRARPGAPICASCPGHDRRQRRARFRRRGLGRARSRPGQSRRLASRRRDRRCRLVCAARQRARPRGRAARQFGLFPRPRRADAARGACRTSCAR